MHCTCRRGFQIGRYRNRGRVFSHRRTRRLSCIRHIAFDLCRFDKTQSGKRNKYLECFQIARNHKRRIWPHLLSLLFHPIHIVGIESHRRRLLFWQNLPDNFYTQCQTYPHHMRYIWHCRLRTSNPWDNRCNCCFFSFHHSTSNSHIIYNGRHQQHR